ncbi:MAG: ATP-grasp domain-containing protein [Gemmatimonadales bacterium]
MAERRPRVLIAGVSTRALAASASRAGYRVTAIDAFGDSDLRAVAEVVPLRQDGGIRFSPAAAAVAARSVDADLVAYTSNFENYPEAVVALSRERRLLGNPAAVLRAVRNPIELMRQLRRRGFAVPVTRASAPPTAVEAGRWLLKPRRSGGGHGTLPWRRGRPVPRRAYLQEHIRGITGSIVFVADGRRAVALGLSRQLVGLRPFGAHGFRYCGSLLASEPVPVFPRQAELLAHATALADAVTEAFGLRGLNGLDFVARDGVPLPIEVNPRYSASMELVERATGCSLFALHAAACDGRLPAPRGLPSRVHGKAIVFARRDIVVGDVDTWQAAPLADVPHLGERIGRGHPICTLLADGADADRCLRTLTDHAAAVYRAVETRARGAA